MSTCHLQSAVGGTRARSCLVSQSSRQGGPHLAQAPRGPAPPPRVVVPGLSAAPAWSGAPWAGAQQLWPTQRVRAMFSLTLTHTPPALADPTPHPGRACSPEQQALFLAFPTVTPTSPRQPATFPLCRELLQAGETGEPLEPVSCSVLTGGSSPHLRQMPSPLTPHPRLAIGVGLSPGPLGSKVWGGDSHAPRKRE